MVNLIVFLKVKGYPLKILLKRTRGLLIKEKIHFGISTFGDLKMSGELIVSPLVHSLSLLSFPLVFLFPFCKSVFCLVLVVVVCC
jgi:hypothetical protein